eukprot:12139662-Karenia_brevis.AAC.1
MDPPESHIGRLISSDRLSQLSTGGSCAASTYLLTIHTQNASYWCTCTEYPHMQQMYHTLCIAALLDCAECGPTDPMYMYRFSDGPNNIIVWTNDSSSCHPVEQ